MPWFTCELTGLSRLAFCVADDPFFKSSKAKYYPEVVLISSKSEIKQVIGPNQRKYDKNPQQFEYCEDIREPMLKVNDDRKIRINLPELLKKKGGKPGKMLLLTVKCWRNVKSSSPGEYDRAWYRLINEDTNQTIDYKNIKQVEKPEGFSDEDAQAPNDGDNNGDNTNESSLTSVTYIAGRIFLDKNNRWVYESYNHCFTSDKHPNLIEKIAEIHRTGDEDLAF